MKYNLPKGLQVISWKLCAVTLLLLGLFSCQPSPTPRVSPPPELTPTRTATEVVSPDVVPEATLTPFSALIPTPTMESQAQETHTTTEEDRVSLTIVYDNNEYLPELRTSWGFSALVEFRGQRLLFDTGGDAPTLLGNMEKLAIDPAGIETIVLSHIHGDHTGGLQGLLQTGSNPMIYLLPSFPARFKQSAAQSGTVIEVSPGQTILEDIYTTGEMGRDIPEQALIIHSAQGLVVVTGCAHPGIVEIVEQAIALFDKPVYLVVGGFHLGDKSASELASIVQAFRDLGVEKVAPTHCSGEAAKSMFEAEYGEDYIRAGVGAVLTIEP